MPAALSLKEADLRDVLALVALHAMLTEPATDVHAAVDRDEWAAAAYAWADAMLGARAPEPIRENA